MFFFLTTDDAPVGRTCVVSLSLDFVIAKW
jgi:hypothetical protein